MVKKINSCKPIVKFFLLTFILTLPSYLLVFLEARKIGFLPEKAFPFIALGTLAPIIAAMILTFKESGGKGLKDLLKRSFDFKRITNKKWILLTILLLPLIFFLAYGVLIFVGQSIPASQFSFATIPILFLMFFILALGEELGWMGYAFESMEISLGTFKATSLLGLIWVIWHIPFYIAMMGSLLPIALAVLCLFGIRFILVWIYNNAGKSIFLAILFHTMYNVTSGVLPNFIIPLGFALTCIFILIAAVIVTFFGK
jgi:uncharacterized protein